MGGGGVRRVSILALSILASFAAYIGAIYAFLNLCFPFGCTEFGGYSFISSIVLLPIILSGFILLVSKKVYPKFHVGKVAAAIVIIIGLLTLWIFSL